MRGAIRAWEDADDVGRPRWCFSIIRVMDGEFNLGDVIDSLCGAAVDLAITFVYVRAVFYHCEGQRDAGSTML